jgi:hypothetical protein
MENKFAYSLSAAIMVIATVTILAMTLRIQMLEQEKEELHEQLHEAHAAPDRCTPVHVTCECPDYEEGWEDSQYAEGCDPRASEFSMDDLEIMCAEFDVHGYIPGC